MSLSRNARRVAFPILFSMADEEFRMALEAFTALREVGRLADLYVFPDQHHRTWPPAHRLAASRHGIHSDRYCLLGDFLVAGRRREEAVRGPAHAREDRKRPVECTSS